MNITITTKAVPRRISLQEIANKLNTIAGSSELFTVSISGISFARNASPVLHTKLILILGLYINSLSTKFNCCVWFSNRGNYIGKFVLGCLPLETLNNFIDSLGKIEDVKVEIAS